MSPKILRFRDGMRRQPFLQRRLQGISKMANSRQAKQSDEHRLLQTLAAFELTWQPSLTTDHSQLFEEPRRRAQRCPPRQPSGCQIGRYDSQPVIAAIFMPKGHFFPALHVENAALTPPMGQLAESAS
ncbi:MAG TPA: hypothetical protein VND64_20300 [Pirellulales bacterium]|nr:hypothetical protein [Pirellulales bacterium]